MLAVLGFLVVVAASTAGAGKRREAPRRARLVALIQDRRRQVDDLDGAVRKLRAELGKAQATASRQSGEERARASRTADLSAMAGTLAVKGHGLVVHLADSSRTPASSDEASAYRIHDVDIQLVVNALFAAGAEAVSVNGNRLVATSPVRAAGATIVVNFRPLTPPYDVTGIGARRAGFDASAIAKRFSRWRSLFGLGFSLREADDLVVPAFTGRVQITRAQPAG